MRTIPREVYNDLKSKFQLNSIQKEVLVGTILGDASIQKKGNYARLHIKHSLNQLSLVEYKRDIFSNIAVMNVREFSQKVGEHDYKFAEFVTLTHPIFLDYYNVFYPNGKKVVPRNIGDFLSSPLSLAVWIMDDGAAEYAGLSIQTHSFTAKEVRLLTRIIGQKFNLEVTMRVNKGRWVIYFPKSVLNNLRELVNNYILSDFKYKLMPYSQRLLMTP